MGEAMRDVIARVEKVATWYESGPAHPVAFEQGRQRIAADLRTLLAALSAPLGEVEKLVERLRESLGWGVGEELTKAGAEALNALHLAAADRIASGVPKELVL